MKYSKKLIYSFLKDLRLSVKSFYFYLEMGMALLFVLVLVFVMPENFEAQVDVHAYLDIEESYKASLKEVLEEGEQMSLTLHTSRDEVVKAMEKERSSVGLFIRYRGDEMTYEYILQGYESDVFINIMRTSIEQEELEKLLGDSKQVEVVTLDKDAEKLSDRLNVLPVLLVMNASFMGLFIIAAYVFMDKDEGTIRAFAVTPARVWEYLLSKVMVMLLTGIGSGLIVVIFVAGTKVHYLHFLVLLIATNIFGSVVGLLIASYFDTMLKAMGALMSAIVILALASLAYYNPAFSPLAIRMLPSYPMIFAFREVLLEKVDIGYVYTTALFFLGCSLPIFLFANYRFKKTITV